MAKKTYTGDLNRHMDFTDCGEQHLPASGKSVQNYIKSIDASKYGVGYTLEDGSAYLFFADAEDRDSYIADPTKTELIKGRIELEPLYHMTVTRISPAFTPVFLGSTGNYLQFSFATLNKDNQEVSEAVTVTYTITRGSSTQVITENYRAGTTVSFNVDQYLLEGSNSISVNVKGQLTKVSTAFGVTYQVINLILSDNMDISRVYDMSDQAASAEIPYSVQGAGQKIMEWYLDGEQLEYIQEEDEITESSAERTKYISLSGLSQGIHTIQFRVGIQVSGETFYSQTLYREIILSTGDSGNPVSVIASELPVSVGIIEAGENAAIYPTQYESFILRLATWNPDGTYRNTAVVSVDGTEVASVVCTEGEEAEVPLTFTTFGAKALAISVDGIARTINANVAQTSMDIHEITSDLEFAFSGEGRTNSSSNKDAWTDGVHNATFTGFDWTGTSGWVNGNLLIPSGASLSFDYAPLGVDPASIGKTLEFEFKSVNVDDDDAVLCDITNANGTGIKITATQVTVKSRAGVVLSRRYKADEDIRMSVVINRRSSVTNKGLVFVYFNGINSMAVNVADTDAITSSTTLSFGGTNAGILLKQVRVYNTALPAGSILNNYILYRDTIAEMMTLYDKNALYEEGTNNFDVDKIAGYLPVMIITGNIPAIENTTDKKLQITADVQYINLQDPTRSFMMEKAIITGQGTSSMTYPKKNLRIYTEKSDATIVYDYEGNVIASRKYSFKSGAQPVNCWCLKTDFAESSGTHNTGVARLWNDVIKNVQVEGEYVLRTDAQKAAVQSAYPYDVRTTVDGFPIVVFYHLTADDDLIFLGKYNFNNDKSTESVFGFCDSSFASDLGRRGGKV